MDFKSNLEAIIQIDSSDRLFMTDSTNVKYYLGRCFTSGSEIMWECSAPSSESKQRKGSYAGMCTSFDKPLYIRAPYLTVPQCKCGLSMRQDLFLRVAVKRVSTGCTQQIHTICEEEKKSCNKSLIMEIDAAAKSKNAASTKDFLVELAVKVLTRISYPAVAYTPNLPAVTTNSSSSHSSTVAVTSPPSVSASVAIGPQEKMNNVRNCFAFLY